MKEYHRPDEEKMNQLLKDNMCSISGVVLRLAWLQGLSRLEIRSLTWDMVDHDSGVLRLPDREVPMEGDTETCLRQWRVLIGDKETYVAVSDTRKTRLAVESISRLARTALDSVGMTDVRLVDLRHDYVRRQLETHDWQYVLRVAGYTVTTYYRYELPKGNETGASENAPSCALTAEEIMPRLRAIMEKEKDSAGGLALWLSCYLGAGIGQAASLTWDAVNFDTDTVCIDGAARAIPAELRETLQAVYRQRGEGDDPHVILTPKARKPIREERLSVVLRTLLMQAGIDAPLSGLWNMIKTQSIKTQIMTFAHKHGSVTNYDMAKALGMGYEAIRRRLDQLEQEGALVHVETRYYPADAVIRPEDYAAAIVERIAAHGPASSDEIAAWLHIGKRRCKKLMNELVLEGKLRYDRKTIQYDSAQ